MRIKTYNELSRIESFRERYEYLRLQGIVGEKTFGYDRYINQLLYRSTKWKKTRRHVIIRDNGFDLGHPDHPIKGMILVHHINPLTLEQIERDDPSIYDLNNLISSSATTHNAIHFSNESLLPKKVIVRTPGDTTPWR